MEKKTCDNCSNVVPVDGPLGYVYVCYTHPRLPFGTSRFCLASRGTPACANWQADTDPDDGDTTAPGTGCGQHCFAPDNMVDCDGCVSKTPEVPAAKNNDGREICVFCGAKTRKCGGARFDIDYRVCTVCRK